jgi:hypothetical protein
VSDTIQTPPSCLRQARRCFRRHLEPRDRFARLVEALRLHPLSGEPTGLRAESLTSADRVPLGLLVGERTITLLDIGGHDAVHRP